jgi:hypothetical protein
MSRFISVVGFIFLFSGSNSLAQAISPSDWDYIKFDDTYHNYRGGSIGLAVCGNNIHTFYLTRNNDQLRYAYSNDGGKLWQTENIEDSTAKTYNDLYGIRKHDPDDSLKLFYENYKSPLLTYRDESTSLSFALDNFGNPHVVFVSKYSSWKEGDHKSWLKHAWRENGIWKTEVLEEATGKNLFSGNLAFTIDKKGIEHLVFLQSQNGVSYMRKENGKWTKDSLAHENVCGLSIAVDNKGKIHVAFGSISGSSYACSSDKGKSWEIEKIYESSWWESNIAVDQEGCPHIVYKNLPGMIFHAVKNNNEKWSTTVIPTPSKLHCGRPVISIDDCDHIHVAFFSSYSDVNVPDGLVYNESSDNGRNWNEGIVDSLADNGSSSGMPGIYICGNKLYLGYELQNFRQQIAVHNIGPDCGILLENGCVSGKMMEELTDTLPRFLDGKKVQLQQNFFTGNNHLSVRVQDAGNIDGDSISVYCNGKWVVQGIKLDSAGVTFNVDFNPNEKNYIIVFLRKDVNAEGGPVRLTFTDPKTKAFLNTIQLVPDSSVAAMVRICKME